MLLEIRGIFHANIKFQLMYIFIIFASLTCAKYSSQTFAIHEHTYARSHTHQRISGAARHKYMLAFHSCGFSFTGICACMKRFLSESPLSYRRGKVSAYTLLGYIHYSTPFHPDRWWATVQHRDSGTPAVLCIKSIPLCMVFFSTLRGRATVAAVPLEPQLS